MSIIVTNILYSFSVRVYGVIFSFTNKQYFLTETTDLCIVLNVESKNTTKYIRKFFDSEKI
jgi:hypothetical protein